MQNPGTSIPYGYHISFSCYGKRLHGNKLGTVDRKTQNIFDTPFIPHNADWETYEKDLMTNPPYILDKHRRQIVLDAIIDVCTFRNWFLWAIHVRTTHVHVVVTAPVKPEKILNDFKSYASRKLNKAGLDPNGCKRWQRHGSTTYKWNPDDVETAFNYVIFGHGEQLDVFLHDGEDLPPP